MKNLFTFLFFLCISVYGYATDLSGTISADMTLDLANSPYYIISNLYVDNGAILTVEDGVEVIFETNRNLYLQQAASIIATGAIFTGETATPGNWGTLSFTGSSSGTFTDCSIEYGGVIDVRSGTLSLTDTDILDFYNYGIRIGDIGPSTLTMNGGNITGDERQYGIYVFDGSTANLEGVFIENFQRGVFAASGSNITLENSSVVGNPYEGIRVRPNATIHFEDVTISGNSVPIIIFGAAELTQAGSNNLSGNEVDIIQVEFSTLSQDWYLPSFNDFAGDVEGYFPWYFDNGNFLIEQGATLEVESDNILKFTSNAALYVDGALIADGSEAEDEWVYFTSYRDDSWGGDSNNDGTASTAASRDWDGVAFNNSSDDASCLMDRCKIRFAGRGNIGAVSTYNASPTINACDVSISYFGFYFSEDSDPVFSNNLIGSSEMTPIAMSIDADPQFFNTNEFSFSDNEYDAVGILGGTLVTDATLPVRDVIDVPNITYLLLGSIIVPDGLSLTIDPSVVVKSYSSSHRITVKGLLTCDGDSGSEIVFTSVKDDTHGNPLDTNKDGTQTVPAVNDWSGIVFESTSDPSSIIDYNIIKYASLSSTFYNTRYIYDGAITLENASPTISNCEIKDVDFGIYSFQSSNPIISNNLITNAAKTPIALSVSSDPTFSDNVFLNANWTALGIIGENIGLDGVIKKRDVAGYENITYLLLEDLIINAGTYVNVEPGIVIKFLATGIFNRGGFSADGLILGEKAYDEIIFTSLKDDNFGNPMDTNGDGNITAPARGDWKTIRFEDTSDDDFNLLRHVQVKFAGGYYSLGWGNITFSDAAGLVENTVVSESNYYGLRCEGASTPTFVNVEILNSRLDPIAMSLKSDPDFGTINNILFAGNGSNGIFILEGNLGSDATVKQRDIAGISNIAYIAQYLTIEPGAILTIEPGVVIKFKDAFSYIRVEGALIADASEGEIIVFTSLKDDSYGGDTNNDGNSTSPSGGDWLSVIFFSSDLEDQNLIDNCLFRYGGRNYSNANWKHGLIRIYSAYVDVKDSQFEQSATAGIGIFGDANPDIADNIFTNIENTPIAMSMFADPVFSGNTSLNNGLTAIGIVPETYSLNKTVPIRDFAGYNNITYYIYNTCTINTGTTITVPAGIVFKRSNIKFFEVNGGLRLEGTENENIVFTDYRDDNFGNPLDTNGDGTSTQPSLSSYEALDFEDVSEDANCLVQYANISYSNYGINLQQAAPTIDHSSFNNMNWGVILRGVSEPFLDNCAFNDLNYGPIAISLVSYPASSLNNTISGSTYKAIGIIGETLVQEVLLPKRDFAGITNIPYFFTANYTIGTSAALTIEPGVVCKFNLDSRLTVKRSLIAEGGADPQSTIVFTSIRDDFYGGDSNADGTATSPNDSDWYGIKFDGESLDPLCRFDYVTVQYAGQGTNQNYGAIVTENASPSILNSTLINNEHGLVAFGASNPTINFSDIYNNANYGVKNVNMAFDIDATNNWWGSNTGPTHSGNPGGTGDEVTDAVIYEPWLTSGATNPIMGDVSLNGLIQAYDASLVLQYVVDPVGNPLNPKQQQVADVSGNGTIMAMDASYILQYVVGLINHFPAELTIPFNHGQVSDVKLVVGNAEVNAGEEFIIPVSLENVRGLNASQIELRFDPELITVIGIEDLTTGMNLNYFIDETTGLIRIAAAGIESIDENFTMANLQMKANSNLSQSTETFVEVDYFAANESDLTSLASNGKIIIYAITTGIGDQGTTNNVEIYPNPFKSILNISIQLSKTENVTLSAYNIFGQKVAELYNGSMEIGANILTWDGTANGKFLENGTYLIHIHQGDRVDVVKTQLCR